MTCAVEETGRARRCRRVGSAMSQYQCIGMQAMLLVHIGQSLGAKEQAVISTDLLNKQPLIPVSSILSFSHVYFLIFASQRSKLTKVFH